MNERGSIAIKQTEEQENGEFHLQSGEDKLGSLRYLIFCSGRMVLIHTEVVRELAGQGFARKLLDRSTDEARNRGLRILPQCPYAKKIMYRYREQYDDVLN